MNPSRSIVLATAILGASQPSESSADDNLDEAPCPGTLEQCDSAGVAAERAGTFRRAAHLFEAACEQGYQNSCANLAEYYFDGRARARNVKKARALFSDACDSQIPGGCAGECIVDFATHNNLLPSYHRKCSQAVQAACDSGNPWMCTKLPLLPSILRPVTKAVFESKCQKEDAKACRGLGAALYSVGKFGDAFAMSQRACDLGSPGGCSNLGELYYAGEGAARDLDTAARLFASACDAGVASGCAGYCLVLAEDPTAWRGSTMERCVKHLALSCEGGNFWMCLRLRQLDTEPELGAPEEEPPETVGECSSFEISRVQRETQRIIALAAQGRFDAVMTQIEQLAASSPPACPQDAVPATNASFKGGLRPAQILRIEQQMRDMENLRNEEHEDFKADMIRIAGEAGINPPVVP